MARARNIKPGFFKNEDLGTADPFVSLLFAGLWTLADKAGILEDRPLRIKAELFPYRDGFDINGYLTVLVSFKLIHRYEVDGIKLIQIANFEKHQNPHHTEKPSEYVSYSITCQQSVKSPLKHGDAPADSLIPDSLQPDSLIPDSLVSSPASQLNPVLNDDLPKDKPPESIKTAVGGKPEGKPAADTPLQEACRLAWAAYSAAYFVRYRTEPVRNAKINALVRQFVQRIGAGESAQIAGWFVQHNNQFYVRQGHAWGGLVSDAEKLRTEWATGNAMTNTRAIQVDKTQTNLDSFAPLIEEARRREEREKADA